MIEPLRIRQTATTNAATAVNVTAQTLLPGTLARIGHLALANRSGESVTVLFGITDIVGFTQFFAKQTVADGDAFGAMVDIFLLEGDQLTAVVTGAANHSTVELYASGELIGKDEPPGA